MKHPTPQLLLNLTVAERELLIAALDKAALEPGLSPETKTKRLQRATQIRWIQAKRIQQLCAALGAFCATPAVHRADQPATEHEAAIDRAWDVLISSTAKKLGWEGEPTSRAMNLKAFRMPKGAYKTEIYRKASLIKALEDHRPSPLGDGTTPTQADGQTTVRRLDNIIDRGDSDFDGGTAHAGPAQQAQRPETDPMKNAWQWPTIRTTAIVAVVLAVVSFFFMSNYHPGLSLIGNVMSGRVPLGPSCSDMGATELCSGYVPYRWILAALALFVGIVALKHRKA